MGVKRTDKRRMDEMRVAVGMTGSAKKILAKSTWAGHMEGMGDDNLTKRTDAQKVEGKWSRGKPKLRWGIALKVT